MPATFYQHPSAPVKPLHDPLDPPVTDRSIVRALKASHAELQQTVKELAHQHAADEFTTLDTTEALERLAARIGWRRLAIICRNLAAINGESF